uniref:Ribonuclease H-like domain-containing protein n=1 Tax=Tanacetum cinerariifolium TaxID=118510 RepID=A0A6L2NV49_TANCI|nr:ribonuclease H-like domain-containing protein [Tanacetum cinerariifolium]
MRRVGKGFSLVAHEFGKGVADEVHDEGVPAAGVTNEGDVSAANDERIETSDDTVMDDVSNQGRMIADMDADADVVLEEAKDVVDDAKDGQDADVQEEESEPAELQEVVDIVTTAKIITEAKEDHAVKRYQALKRKPQTEVQAKKNMMIYLKNVVGFKMDYFKEMSYDDIRLIFEAKFDSNVTFLQKTKEQIDEEESRALKRINKTPTKKAEKKAKDIHAQIWKNQRSVYGPAKVKSWKLLKSCGVQIIAFTTTQLILLVEGKYPLTRFTLDLMLNDVRLEVEEESKKNVRSRSDKGYHAVPSPYTRNCIPSKPDLMFIDEQVESESVHVISNVSSSAVKTVESKVESVDVVSNVSSSFVKSVELKVESVNVKIRLGKGARAHGECRYMTRNKCYLTDYEDYDGGLVSFGDGKGRISRKGKIKSRTLDFDDVYCCKELKYNLLSVSQKCDKKNNVLFTDTECLVLSSNFKLLDESQVLLRVPRKDNIYSVDLKSVVPTGGLTCLFAKATTDESNLWHMRLGHINYKTMNKLVRGNLVRGLPLKIFENNHGCVACQKGKQHKVSYKAKLLNSISKPLHMLHMDLFGIKKKFSVARTPQQNGVAKKKNKTLIEAARTMALVIKPHNKTPYELICGRPPLIDFMKPFGCPVTILNTKDYLGNGPDWLFDVDSLKISMNYVLVVAGFQTNGIPGTKDNIVAGPKDSAVDARKKATKLDESQVLDNGGKDDQVTRSEFEGILQQESQTEHINSTNSFNTISSLVNTAGPSFVNGASLSPINAIGTPASTNAFEEHPLNDFILSKCILSSTCSYCDSNN